MVNCDLDLRDIYKKIDQSKSCKNKKIVKS